MRVPITLLLMSTLFVSGCGGWSESRANPKNWFGNSRSEVIVQSAGTQAAEEAANPLIEQNRRDGIFSRDRKAPPYQGTLVDQVTSLSVEPTPTGAIVRVTGLTLRQGAFDVRLVRDSQDGPVDGVMSYSLRALQPVNTPQGPPRTREIQAGDFLSNEELALTGSIRVTGARNVQTTRR